MILLIPLVLMVRGDGFAATCRALARLPIPALRCALDRMRNRIEALDASCVRLLHGNRIHLALVFGYFLRGWLIGALESYLLLLWFGLSSSLRVAYVMESVGSMFRLIFFFVPSGIGGQGASFMALFKLYGFPRATGGAFVLRSSAARSSPGSGSVFCLLSCSARRAPRRRPPIPTVLPGSGAGLGAHYQLRVSSIDPWLAGWQITR